MICLLVLAEDAEARSANAAAWMAAGTLIFGGLYLRFPLVCATNICTSACLLASHAAEVEEEQPVGPYALRSAMTAELVAIFIRLAMLYLAERLMRFGVRKEVLIHLGRCQLSGVSSLLDLMCDAVVDLDQDFRMKEHVPKMAHMLMHGSGRQLRGAKFLDFIGDDEDRTSATAALQQSRQHFGRAAGMFKARLRDSMGNLVRVLLYHVPYTSVGGDTHYLVGFREEPDESACAPLQSEARAGSRMPNAVLRADIANVLHSGAPGSASETSDSRSSRSSLGSRGGESAYGEHEAPDTGMTVSFTVRAGLPVLAMGEDLCERLGVVAGEKCGLAEFLPMQGIASSIQTNIRQEAHSCGAVEARRQVLGEVEGAGGERHRRERGPPVHQGRRGDRVRKQPRARRGARPWHGLRGLRVASAL